MIKLNCHRDIDDEVDDCGKNEGSPENDEGENQEDDEQCSDLGLNELYKGFIFI